MKPLAKLALPATFLAWSFGLTAAAPPDNPRALSARVVQFCEAHLGQKVDSGQCSALAWDALNAAGAKPRLYPDHPRKGDYVWGKEVYLLEAGPSGPRVTGDLRKVKPGFIIQYRNTRWAGGTYLHHTSVVASVNVKAKTLRIYQQNVNNTQHVVEDSHKLDNLKTGWIRIYRPIRAKKT
jgi:hypothetical protein